jgi:outer membrane biosynthesis protein TonB
MTIKSSPHEPAFRGQGRRHTGTPIYPDADKAAGRGGTVTMEAVINEDGFVNDVQDLAGGDSALQPSLTGGTM